jgi:hypothetical protein
MMVQYVGRGNPAFFAFRPSALGVSGSAVPSTTDAGAPTVPSLKEQQRQHFGLIDVKAAAAARNFFFFFFYTTPLYYTTFSTLCQAFPAYLSKFSCSAKFSRAIQKVIDKSQILCYNICIVKVRRKKQMKGSKKGKVISLGTFKPTDTRNELHFAVQKSTRAQVFRDRTKYSRKRKHKNKWEG